MQLKKGKLISFLKKKKVLPVALKATQFTAHPAAQATFSLQVALPLLDVVHLACSVGNAAAGPYRLSTSVLALALPCTADGDLREAYAIASPR